MAFSVTVISPMAKPERISRSLGIYAGKVTITSYSASLVECTAITKYFVPTSNGATGGFKDGVVSVQVDGPSSGGYIVDWNYASGAFKCYAPGAVSIPVDSALSGAALLFASGGGAGALHATSAVGSITMTSTAVEAAANVLIGTFGFVAIGFVHA